MLPHNLHQEEHSQTPVFIQRPNRKRARGILTRARKQDANSESDDQAQADDSTTLRHCLPIRQRVSHVDSGLGPPISPTTLIQRPTLPFDVSSATKPVKNVKLDEKAPAGVRLPKEILEMMLDHTIHTEMQDFSKAKPRKFHRKLRKARLLELCTIDSNWRAAVERVTFQSLDLGLLTARKTETFKRLVIGDPAEQSDEDATHRLSLRINLKMIRVDVSMDRLSGLKRLFAVLLQWDMDDRLPSRAPLELNVGVHEMKECESESESESERSQGVLKNMPVSRYISSFGIAGRHRDRRLRSLGNATMLMLGPYMPNLRAFSFEYSPHNWKHLSSKSKEIPGPCFSTR